MKTKRPNLKTKVSLFFCHKATTALLLAVIIFGTATAQQELVFKTCLLQSGTAGADGAVYRFPAITANVDAVIKINGRSSALVTLESPDLRNTGHDKAFQPQVAYNHGNTQGSTDWWMEFEVSFVESNTTNPIVVNSFDVTAIDVDGDGSKLNEYICLYKQQSYTTENNTLLFITPVSNIISSQSVNGKKVDGPVTNFVNIDTNATRVMVTNKYQNTSSFIIRTGAKTTGNSGATNRMYSFWFKGFTYQSPVLHSLPVTLINWNAVYNNNAVTLKWNTSVEQNVSHFVIEKSLDGVEYTDAAVLFAVGNSNNEQLYSYNDKVPAGTRGMIYYRLRMTDMNGQYNISKVKRVSLGDNDLVKVMAYPNPVINELHITIPSLWQDKQVTYMLANINGQMLTTFTTSQAGQTETLKMSDKPAGMYVLKVSQGQETAVQAITKLKN